jgi:hypothetical protein
MTSDNQSSSSILRIQKVHYYVHCISQPVPIQSQMNSDRTHFRFLSCSIPSGIVTWHVCGDEMLIRYIRNFWLRHATKGPTQM